MARQPSPNMIMRPSDHVIALSSPLLRQRAHNELRQIDAVGAVHAKRFAIVPLLKEEPVGVDRLRVLAHEVEQEHNR